jgi:regulator of cell morphogenesis and NO signaling
VNSHKKQHPELERIMEVFSELAAVLMQHTRYEEETLFPYIRQIENTHRRKESYGRLFVRTMRKPLGAINGEHDKIASLLQVLRDITHNYAFKGNACTNHRVVFNKLREFDNDLVQHKHLENNILLPRAIAMEQDLLEA